MKGICYTFVSMSYPSALLLAVRYNDSNVLEALTRVRSVTFSTRPSYPSMNLSVLLLLSFFSTSVVYFSYLHAQQHCTVSPNVARGFRELPLDISDLLGNEMVCSSDGVCDVHCLIGSRTASWLLVQGLPDNENQQSLDQCRLKRRYQYRTQEINVM